MSKTKDKTQANATRFPIAIIGAGFAGMGMGIRLKQAGIEDFTIFEAAEEVGGTWRENTYPGCACDVPSFLYSYSFEQSPRWSRMFGEQHEIWSYMKDCAQKYHLRPHIRFRSRVASLVFDEACGAWRLTLESGETFQARVVISATGGLSKPAIPKITGADSFVGPRFHSAEWDHSVDLKNKRVAVIGTGASAIQIVPSIVSDVSEMYVFQRSPAWVMPKPDRPISSLEKQLYRWLPPLQHAYRALLYWWMELRGLAFVKYPKLLEYAEKQALAHLASAIQDPHLRAKLTPDYRMGCKRILISNDYYPALAQPHTHVITNAIDSIQPHSIRTQDGTEYPADVILYCTGFRVMDFLAPMTVVGLEGRELNTLWLQQGIETLHGIAVSGFPNFYFLVGPNTGLGHNSILFMIEAQIHYILQCIETLQTKAARYLDLRASVQKNFQQEIAQRSEKTIWKSGCRSWYLTEDGKNYTLWPGYTFEYWWRTRHFSLADYDIIRNPPVA
ncbi:NAD(P)/FAD-dependent oxidoreductase [Myxococcota bacterium]|nr:NAD(P)/FAD-dependent oxidoreductase [Myxococcota bacterium]